MEEEEEMLRLVLVVLLLLLLPTTAALTMGTMILLITLTTTLMIPSCFFFWPLRLLLLCVVCCDVRFLFYILCIRNKATGTRKTDTIRTAVEQKILRSRPNSLRPPNIQTIESIGGGDYFVNYFSFFLLQKLYLKVKYFVC